MEFSFALISTVENQLTPECQYFSITLYWSLSELLDILADTALQCNWFVADTSKRFNPKYIVMIKAINKNEKRTTGVNEMVKSFCVLRISLFHFLSDWMKNDVFFIKWDEKAENRRIKRIDSRSLLRCSLTTRNLFLKWQAKKFLVGLLQRIIFNLFFSRENRWPNRTSIYFEWLGILHCKTWNDSLNVHCTPFNSN